MLKKIGIINAVMFLILFVLGIMMIPQGMLRVISWTALKLVVPLVGFFMMFVNVFVIIVKRVWKKKKPSTLPTVLSILICLAYIAPILVTMGIVNIPYPANLDETKPSLTVLWPMKEGAAVAWGGDDMDRNYPHIMWGSERWAYDIVKEPFDTKDPDLTSYGIWDQEVIAPVSGTVIGVDNDEKDIEPNTEENDTITGNHVYLRVEETGTYLILVHLKKGSITVSVGDKVEAGQVIAKAGNSGSTSEPHLHIHHQRQDPTKTLHSALAEGLPLYFKTSKGIVMPQGLSVDGSIDATYVEP